MSEGIKVISKNKKATFDYFIDEKIEAGIVLSGTEVKSIRKGNVNLKDSYASIKEGEIYIHGMHISPYEQGNIFNKDPFRDRKLLLHKREILKMIGAIKQQGLTLVPIVIYFKRNKLKIELGLGKGKKLYDKRDSISKKDAEREISKKFKSNYRE